MTRDEFLRNVVTWGDLIAFCYDEDCDYCEDVISNDDLDEYICEDIQDLLNSGESWIYIRDCLDGIHGDYPYYHRDGCLDYDRLNEFGDFESYKEDVLDWGDRYGAWDEEDEEADEYIVSSQDESEEEPIFEEAFPIFDLFSSCQSDMAVQIAEHAKKQAERMAEIDRALQELIPF